MPLPNTVTSDPGDADVYWANQFAFDGHDSYIRFQVGQQNEGQFLWSTWAQEDLRFRTGRRGRTAATTPAREEAPVQPSTAARNAVRLT